MCKLSAPPRWFYKVQIIHPAKSHGVELHLPQTVDVFKYNGEQEYPLEDTKLLYGQFEKNAA